MSTDAPTRTPHPAKFSDPVLAHAVRFLTETQTGEPRRLLDPFAGVGRVHELSDHVPNLLTYGVELEPEWAGQHQRNTTGDSTNLDEVCETAWGLGTESFDVVFTSCTYGNRMADLYDGRDGSKRYTYRIYLDRELSPNNSGGMQWGREYRDLHSIVWARSVQMLKPGGLFILNISNHLRKIGTAQQEIPVVEWHLAHLLQACGLFLVRTEQIGTQRMKNGANHEARADCEHLLILRKP